MPHRRSVCAKVRAAVKNFFRHPALTLVLKLRLWREGRVYSLWRALAFSLPWKDEFMHNVTHHAQHRSQQRGVPPLIRLWLLDYGAEQYDGHGGIVRFFNAPTIRQLEREVGREPVRRMAEFLRCYLVQCSDDGSIITVGKRHGNKHVWRH
jgi:hypothetical protein